MGDAAHYDSVGADAAVTAPGGMVRVRARVAARVEQLLFDPARAVTIFWIGGTLAGLSALPSGTWSHDDRTALIVVVAIAAAFAALRLGAGGRLPGWSLNVDTVVAVTLLSVATAVGASAHEDLSVLYLWEALFAGLYFGLTQAVASWGLAAAAYALVLGFGPHVSNPVFSWLAIFGTGSVIFAVAHVLVGLLRASSREDHLTGLPNRRTWDQRLEEEIERARRSRAPLSLVIVDVDRFKEVNDERGHQEGDRILTRLAQGWCATLRGGGDFVARIGGDEFGLLSPGSSEAGIRHVVSRLREVSPSGVTCSFGVATWDREESAANLFRRADEAMYQAKREGR